MYIAFIVVAVLFTFFLAFSPFVPDEFWKKLNSKINKKNLAEDIERKIKEEKKKEKEKQLSREVEEVFSMDLQKARSKQGIKTIEEKVNNLAKIASILCKEQRRINLEVGSGKCNPRDEKVLEVNRRVQEIRNEWSTARHLAVKVDPDLEYRLFTYSDIVNSQDLVLGSVNNLTTYIIFENKNQRGC